MGSSGLLSPSHSFSLLDPAVSFSLIKTKPKQYFSAEISPHIAPSLSCGRRGHLEQSTSSHTSTCLLSLQGPRSPLLTAIPHHCPGNPEVTPHSSHFLSLPGHLGMSMPTFLLMVFLPILLNRDAKNRSNTWFFPVSLIKKLSCHLSHVEVLPYYPEVLSSTS